MPSVSDNGPSFVVDTVKIALKMLEVKQKFGCVYHPQSQGAVERANGTFREEKKKIKADS